MGELSILPSYLARALNLLPYRDHEIDGFPFMMCDVTALES